MLNIILTRGKQTPALIINIQPTLFNQGIKDDFWKKENFSMNDMNKNNEFTCE